MTNLKYFQLTDSAKSKYISLVNRLERNGLSVKQAQNLSDSDLKKAIGFKGKQASFKGLKRNINAIDPSVNKDYERAQELSKHIASKEKTVKAKSIKYKIATKIIGHNRYWNGVDKAVDINRNLTKNQALEIVDRTIKSAKVDFQALSSQQKEIIQAISP